MFTHRSTQKELIDLGSAHYTLDAYQHCIKKLFRVNKFFGFFYSTRKLLKAYPSNSSLLDIGCGSGLFLLNLSNYFPKMNMLGIDISKEAIVVAQNEALNFAGANVTFQLQNGPNLNDIKKPVDIILATLVCHHLTDDELIIFFQETYNKAQKVVILNDLHRHPIAYWFYRLFSRILFQDAMISHDGAISILRGFKKSEWLRLLQRAGIPHYKIQWCFPFRWRITLWKK